MEDAHPLSEGRSAEEVQFDINVLIEEALQTLGELRNAELGKNDFMLVLGLFNRPLARLMWEYYNAGRRQQA